MASDQNVAVTPNQTITDNNLVLGASPITTAPASPAITRSLDLEFEAEGPSPGFGSTTGVSSGTAVVDLFPYASSRLQSGGSGITNGSVFTPAVTTGAQISRSSSMPVITLTNPSTIISPASTPSITNLQLLAPCRHCILQH